MPDSHRWVAVYNDNSILEEDGHCFADVDQSRLVSFRLLPNNEGGREFTLKVGADMRPIFFRRRQITIGLSEQSYQTAHVLGFQKTVRGVNVQCLCFVLPDGSVLLSDDSGAV